MSGMTDPSFALESFQLAVSAGGIHLEQGRIHPDVHLHVDQAHGKPRFTYVRLEGSVVTAFATFVPNGHDRGHANLTVGYAVPEPYRNQGRAKSIFAAGITELQNAFRGHPPFYIEAVVGAHNIASLRVAAAVLGGAPESIEDENSGEPALRYAKLYETGK